MSSRPTATTGELGEWKEAPEALALPEARSGGAATATADGLLLIGGANADGPVATTLKSDFNAAGALGKWTPEKPLATAQTGATAGVVGDFVWLFGGRDANGPVGDRPARQLRPAGRRGPPRRTPTRARSSRWATSTPRANLPGAAGGRRGLGGQRRALRRRRRPMDPRPHAEVYWAIPTNDGDIAEWKHLEVSDLPTPLTGGAPRRQRPERDHRRRHDERRACVATSYPGEHRPAGAVLPARPGRRDRARA